LAALWVLAPALAVEDLGECRVARAVSAHRPRPSRHHRAESESPWPFCRCGDETLARMACHDGEWGQEATVGTLTVTVDCDPAGAGVGQEAPDGARVGRSRSIRRGRRAVRTVAGDWRP